MADVQVTDLAETLEIQDVDFLHVKNGSSGIDEKFLWSRFLLPLSKGGTGATTALDARTNLDVYSKDETDDQYVFGDSYQPKNMIPDGAFEFWYEGVSQTSSGYGSDTLSQNLHNGTTVTHNRVTLARSNAAAIRNPTIKYLSRSIVASVTGAPNYAGKNKIIPDVRTFAGKTISLSFECSTNLTNQQIAVELKQVFGTSGSADVTGIGSQLVTIGGSFAEYNINIDVPSVDGKTIDDDSYLAVNFWFDAGSDFDERSASLGHQSGIVDLTAIQAIEGDKAYKFEELTELEAYNRASAFYWETEKSETAKMAGRSGSTVACAIAYVYPSKMIGTPEVTNGTFSNGTFFNQSVGTTTCNTNLIATESASTALEGAGKVFDARLGGTDL